MNQNRRAPGALRLTPASARECFQYALQVLAKVTALKAPHFVEPDGSDGSFRALSSIVHCAPHPARARAQTVALGHPPRGCRGTGVVQFFNTASTFADTIALVVPANFRRYALQKKLAPAYRWIGAHSLGRAIFAWPTGATAPAHMEFQIWTRLPAPRFGDHRQLQPAPYQHPSFSLRRYEPVPGALGLFAQPFDFAVPCQGFQNYTRRETRASRCEKNRPWLLLHSPRARTRRALWTLDYHALAYECARDVPGFLPSDVVAAFTQHHGRERASRESA